VKKPKSKSPVNLAGYERLAQRVLPKPIFDHAAGGAEDEITLRDNTAAFERLRLVPHILRDVTARDHAVTILGQRASFPVILAPIACLRRFHRDGELAAARAAGGAGIPCMLSTGSCLSLEEVAEASNASLFFQLYPYSDAEITRRLVERAETAGYKAIALTVDVPVGGRRERDIINQYVYPPRLLRKSLTKVGFTDKHLNFDPTQLPAFAAEALTVAFTWELVAWLRSLTRLPLLLKGVLAKSDALRAVDYGVDGVVVSNHGGRQLDGTPAAIEVLEEIAGAVHGRMEILFDSGVRRGTDVLKALALGAKAVLLGRPYVWALAAGGQAGVQNALRLLREEFDVAMALTGSARVAEIDSSLIWRGAARQIDRG